MADLLTPDTLPERIETEAELEELLSRPSPAAVEAMRALDGDLLLLGVGGKMGPSLARLARRACDAAGSKRRILAASRFSEPGLRDRLAADGVETIACDLLDDKALNALPDAPNVIFMAGAKFGTTGREAHAWVVNAYLPGRVARRFARSRVVALSTGNVYPFTPIAHGGATEETPVAPLGDYAQSCVGRERMFEHAALELGARVLIFRLNYAIELRYGILLDVAQRVAEGRPVHLAMGAANVIWQGDANERILRSLAHCSAPATKLNVTGPETVSIRRLALCMAAALGAEPYFEGEEAETALLSNAARSMYLFGYPTVPLERMLDWVAHWVRIGGPTLNKPTRFEVRDGKF